MVKAANDASEEADNIIIGKNTGKWDCFLQRNMLYKSHQHQGYVGIGVYEGDGDGG